MIIVIVTYHLLIVDVTSAKVMETDGNGKSNDKNKSALASNCTYTLRTHEPCVPTKQRINALTISRALFPFGQQHVDRLRDRIVLREDHTNAILG